MRLLTFDEAIKDSMVDARSKRHLVLGNGFSISCAPDIFHYGSLFNAADFSSHPELEAVFAALDTQDFEAAIRALESGAKLLPIYADGPAGAPAKMLSDAEALKEILLQTIAGTHPAYPGTISDERFRKCRTFLRRFLLGHGQNVFTLNYDLLLYWALMHEDCDGPDDEAVAHKDGFGSDEDDFDADYVIWHGETASRKGNVHYLHGALHLFDAGSELQKFTWCRTEERLIEQARRAMSDGKFPLFVAEGSTEKKFTKIRHNAYLFQALKTLKGCADTARHCFFIHGHSLDKNDDHILKRIGRGKCSTIYVSLFGDPENENNRTIIKRAEWVASLRSDSYPLSVKFYDATSVDIWGA